MALGAREPQELQRCAFAPHPATRRPSSRAGRCIGPGRSEATRLLLVTYDQVSGGGRASTPEQANARTLAIVAAEGAGRRKLHSLGYRLADIAKRPNKLFRLPLLKAQNRPQSDCRPWGA